jgi:hypothetical protein
LDREGERVKDEDCWVVSQFAKLNFFRDTRARGGILKLILGRFRNLDSQSALPGFNFPARHGFVVAQIQKRRKRIVFPIYEITEPEHRAIPIINAGLSDIEFASHLHEEANDIANIPK